MVDPAFLGRSITFFDKPLNLQSSSNFIKQSPALGDGETMNFGFFLKGDMPDTDGDGDDYLDDYYSISIMDIDALAWHASSTDAIDGNSYWCGDEEIGGYLDRGMG